MYNGSCKLNKSRGNKVVFKNIHQANKELKRLRSLKDGKNYIISFSKTGKFSVVEQSAKHDAYIASMGEEEQNMKISDWLERERINLYGK